MRGTGHPPYRLLVVALLTAAALFASPGTASGETVARRESAEAVLLTKINDVRAAHHLPALKASSLLSNAAGRHSANMAWKGYFQHDFKKDGSWYSFGTWIRWYWPGPGYKAWTAGENLAWGAPGLSPGKAVNMWLNSPNHRANLLGVWSYVGVGIVHVVSPGGYFNPYSEVTIVTADFGHRSK
jgi:uncharacterized protein YkwD